MKRKISAILLVVVAIGAIFTFMACGYDDLYGTYIDTENTMRLVLTEDDAVFGSLDNTKSFFVKYYDGGKKLGISTDSWKCYWKDFDYAFTANGDDTLTLVGYIAYDTQDASSIITEGNELYGRIEKDSDGKLLTRNVVKRDDGTEAGEYIYHHTLVLQ